MMKLLSSFAELHSEEEQMDDLMFDKEREKQTCSKVELSNNDEQKRKKK